MIEQADLFGASTVLIEDCASGIALIQQLRDDGFYKLQACKPKGSKFERLQAQTAVIEAGLILLPADASWKEDYLFELMMFPAGKYDDQVDSTSQALAWLAQPGGGYAWLQTMDEVERRRALGDTPPLAELTVRFDFPSPNDEFKVSTGRWVKRSPDGFYHVSEQEWAGIAWTRGVRRCAADS